MKGSHTQIRYILLTTVIFLLPFILIAAICFVLKDMLSPETSVITNMTIVLFCFLGISIILCIFTIAKILHDLFSVIRDLKTIIPHYILEDSISPDEMNKKGLFNITTEARNIISAISKHIYSVQSERTNLQYTKTEIQLESIYDALCKTIFNRNHTEKLIQEKISNIIPVNKLYLAILDIDFFKKVNDTYGHDAGDYILKEVTTTLLGGLRDEDVIGRWGGEEFCVVFESSSQETAHMIFERLRESIEKTEFTYISPKEEEFTIPCTLSIGFTCYDGADIQKTMTRADRALYNSKENGRNQVSYCSED